MVQKVPNTLLHVIDMNNYEMMKHLEVSFVIFNKLQREADVK